MRHIRCPGKHGISLGPALSRSLWNLVAVLERDCLGGVDGSDLLGLGVG